MSASDYESSVSKVFISHRRQSFSLPFGIINYVTQNPISSDGLQKLQKTCKYIFAKNKIIVIDVPIIYDFGSTLSSNFNYSKNSYYRVYFPLKGIKYWPTLRFSIFREGNVLSNIYRCNLKQLEIFNQSLKLAEFDFLLNGGKIISLWLNKVNIYDSLEELVSSDRILAKAGIYQIITV